MKIKALMLFLAAFAAGCTDPEKVFTVVFDSNGGSEVAAQTVKTNDKATEPEPAPVLEGYSFMGWYTDNQTFSDQWNFEDDVVTADITLYAKWSVKTQTIRFTWEYAGRRTKEIRITATAGKQFTIDWGDGSDIETITGTGDWQLFTYRHSEPVLYTVIISGEGSFTDFNLRFYDAPNGSRNGIIDLDIRECTELRTLNVAYNRLTNLDLSSNTALVWLQCQQNRLTHLDLSNNQALTSVTCGNIQLSSLDLSNQMALIILSCEYNQLTYLNLSNNMNLRQLGCSRNGLTHLDLSNHSELWRLTCDFNQLSSLVLSQKAPLTFLSCSTNCLHPLLFWKLIPLMNKLFRQCAVHKLAKNSLIYVICVLLIQKSKATKIAYYVAFVTLQTMYQSIIKSNPFH